MLADVTAAPVLRLPPERRARNVRRVFHEDCLIDLIEKNPVGVREKRRTFYLRRQTHYSLEGTSSLPNPRLHASSGSAAAAVETLPRHHAWP